MSIELLPLGKKCNIACTYCYQQDERTATDNAAPPYDLESMKAALLAEGVGNGVGFSLFGGESLLFPINDMTKMVEWAASIGAPVGVQTNGSLITQRHIDLFKKHRMSVGVSIDGPDELNDARQARDPKATAATTAKSIANLEWLLREKISTSLIVTITAINVGTDDRLNRLLEWLDGLHQQGLRYLNIHKLEPHGDDALALTQERQIGVLRYLRAQLTGFTHISPFDDMKKSLLQESGSNCIYGFCDPYTTPAVRGIDGQGTRGNCGRTNQDGVGYVKADTAGHERYLALYLTPMEQGGCGGCRFFLSCGGGNCPGEGGGGDWRAKTVHCATLTALFKDLEQELFRDGREPISMSLRRPALEAQRIASWTGKPALVQNVPHGDAPHGDRAHGDHTDTPEWAKRAEAAHHDVVHSDWASDFDDRDLPTKHGDAPHGDHSDQTSVPAA